jgi:mono/diheme cytochrome c family protein
VTFLDRGFLPGKRFLDRKGRSVRWRDPYPVSPGCFLAAFGRALVVMDEAGDYEIAHELDSSIPEQLRLHEPRLIRSRPRERLIPAVVPSEDGMATFSVMDVTIGRNMGGIEHGQIKKLLVMEELARPGANDMNPDIISYNGKNFLLHRILGTVPVEADGSAHFKAPAGRAIFFYALDGDSLAAKAMPSWLSAVPGEQVSCVGCHEDKALAPPDRLARHKPLALRRGPSKLEPIGGVPEIFDYVRDIQPIWDKHCVSCHNYEKHAGDLLLVGDMTPSWSISYYEIKRNRTERTWGVGGGLIGCNPGYEPDPYSVASGDSKLIDVLRKGHKDVKLSPAEMQRILRWADAGTTFAGTYAALDSASARKNQIRLRAKRDEAYNRACKPAVEALARRCDACHQPKGKPRPGGWVTGEIRQVGHRFNVTRPEKSLLLLAPLSKKAGGLQICKRTDDSPQGAGHPPIFADKSDPDYRALESFVGLVAKQYDRKRWFDPGHVPTDWYLREMKRFDVLPADYDPTSPEAWDGYEIDRRYFNMLYRLANSPTEAR